MTIALRLAGVLLLALVAGAVYLGAFRSIRISERELGPFVFVYRDMTGTDMRQVGAITTAVDQLLAEASIANRKPLDVFFPDGRAEIGFAVEGASTAQLQALTDKAKVREILSQRFATTEFPWRSRLSFVIGYFKVDPALAKFRAAHGYRAAEAMTLNLGRTILYFQPIILR